MQIKRSKVVILFTLIFFIPIFSLYSYWLVVPTVNGDAASYQALYDALSTASFDEVQELGRFYVTSSEFSPYVLWVGAKLSFDKDIYITFFNVVLLYGLFFFIVNRSFDLGILLLSYLLITNFYIVVLMTSAERLKFAYIFLIFAILSKQRMRIFFLLTAITMHFQVIIVIAAQILYLYSSKFKDSLLDTKSESNKIGFFRPFLFISLGTIFLWYSKDGLLYKINSALADNSSVSELLQLFLLFAASAPLFKRRLEAFMLFLFYGILIMLLGGSRVNMMAYSSVLYIVLSEDSLNRFRVKAIPFYLVCIYLSFKSIGYIQRTFIQGHGWVI